VILFFFVLRLIQKIDTREKELVQLNEEIRTLEQTNLSITDKLKLAHLANNTTYTYELDNIQ
jgi:hypothetical protein